MPKIVQDHRNKPQIELTLTHDFISKYSLEQLVNDIISPSFIISFDGSGTFTIPFKFPNFKDYDEEFLNQFIELFNSILKQYGLEAYADQLLFLANTYVKTDREKHQDIYKHDTLRTRGKLLLNFIKVPLPQYTIETIQNAFFDHLDSYEKDELLLGYLSMLSGKPESEFKNTGGEIDLSKIDHDLQNKVIKQIVAHFNIHVEMPELKKPKAQVELKKPKGQEHTNYLIVSKNIKINFSYDKSGKKASFSEIEPDQCIKFNTLIVKALFKEQNENKTEFYKALLQHDFYYSNDYRKLSNAVGAYDRNGHNAFNLAELHRLLMKFLRKVKFPDLGSNPKNNQKRNQFIYQYFDLLGLIPKTPKTNRISESIKDGAYLESNPNFASIWFGDTLKNA